MTVTSPKGFLSAGIACGLKSSGKPDLSLIYSETPAVAAGVFTTNQVKGNPIIVSRANLNGGLAQAIISNAGNANTWTGKKGLADAWEMAELTASALGIKKNHVLVTSTGVIAKPLPMPKVRKGILKIVKQLSNKGGHDSARAIMTTDTRPKEIVVKIGGITIGGIAKGSGMIEPNMATMHCFITTDAFIDRRLLQKLLQEAVDRSFNLISVDNCMSTSDCVFVLANGMSGIKVKGDLVKKFADALNKVCIYLAKEIVRDGEGAKKLMEVVVKGANDKADAKKVAKAIIGNFLLKAAVFGKDRNVGRILQAVGSTDARVDWGGFSFDWKIGKKEDRIKVDLASGNSTVTAWGCDLTEGYVKINAKYHT